MSDNLLVVINNDKVFKDNNEFYCGNYNLKILPEGLNNYHRVQYIVRSSSKKKNQKINLKNIKAASNIFKFIYFVLKTFRIPNVSYLLVCITPYTFFSFLILFLFRRRVFVYLFSSGHEEYKHILGRWFVWVYHIMYVIVTSNSKVIVCHERLYNKKNKRFDDFTSNYPYKNNNESIINWKPKYSLKKGLEQYIKFKQKLLRT